MSYVPFNISASRNVNMQKTPNKLDEMLTCSVRCYNNVSRTYCSTSADVATVNNVGICACSCCFDSCASCARRETIDVALIENSSKPIASKIGIAIGSPAISPHMPTQQSFACAASMIVFTKRKIAGWYGWYQVPPPTESLSRSGKQS